MTRRKRSGERWTATSEADQRQLQMPNLNKNTTIRECQQMATAIQRSSGSSQWGSGATHLAPEGVLPQPAPRERAGRRGQLTKGKCRYSPRPEGRVAQGRPARTRRATTNEKIEKNSEALHCHGVRRLEARRGTCLLYTSPSPRDVEESRMPSSA